MTKRMTLLAKKEGLSTSDFRSYWAGPHAQLAMGMAGIAKYVHNRVDKVLWTSGNETVFTVDGIVELSFLNAEAMHAAQASTVGQKYIPEDEPIFLKGWTLCVVETDQNGPIDKGVKVIVAFHAPPEIRIDLLRDLSNLSALGHSFTLNWTISTACRERLWTEPFPPDGFLCVWVASVAQAHEAFDPSSKLRQVIERHVDGGVAYLIDELVIC